MKTNTEVGKKGQNSPTPLLQSLHCGISLGQPTAGSSRNGWGCLDPDGSLSSAFGAPSTPPCSGTGTDREKPRAFHKSSKMSNLEHWRPAELQAGKQLPRTQLGTFTLTTRTDKESQARLSASHSKAPNPRKKSHTAN